MLYLALDSRLLSSYYSRDKNLLNRTVLWYSVKAKQYTAHQEVTEESLQIKKTNGQKQFWNTIRQSLFRIQLKSKITISIIARLFRV